MALGIIWGTGAYCFAFVELYRVNLPFEKVYTGMAMFGVADVIAAGCFAAMLYKLDIRGALVTLSSVLMLSSFALFIYLRGRPELVQKPESADIAFVVLLLCIRATSFCLLGFVQYSVTTETPTLLLGQAFALTNLLRYTFVAMVPMVVSKLPDPIISVIACALVAFFSSLNLKTGLRYD